MAGDVLFASLERAVALRLLELLAGSTELPAGRVYTVTPREVGADPFVLVRRIGGIPPLSRPLVLDEGDLQLDAYGGTQRQAERLARRLQAELAELAGPIDDGTFAGAITGTSLGAMRYVPDEAFEPARPRYVLDVTAWLRIGRLSPSGTTSAVFPAAAVTP